MGRKTRYSAQTVETILEAVRHSGSDRVAIEAAGVSQATFYRWQQEYEEFREGIAQAKLEYRKNCSDVLRQQAQWSFEDYLFGRVVEEWTTHETVRDGDKTIYTEVSKRVKRGVPQWAIERVLGKPLDELEAVKCLVESGWIPRHVLIVATESLDEVRDRVRQAFQPEDSKN
jgi:transposase